MPRDARALAALLAGGTLLRLVLAGVLGFGYGESYYIATARSLALSYFDQPPLFLWLSHAMIVAGGTGHLWLRLPFVLMFAGSTWLLYRLANGLFGRPAGLWAAVLLNLSALFLVSIGTWVQPDGPLVLFLLAGMACLARVVLQDPAALPRATAWRRWLAAGLCFGLAALSKYHAWLTIGGLGLFLLAHPAGRRWLRHPAPWAALGLAVLLFTPVLVWNAQHGWASFLFQAARGAGPGFRPDWLALNLVGQAVWLLPWIWLPLVVASATALARRPRDAALWFLVLPALPPILVFTAAASWSDVGNHFHWQAPGYLLLFPILGAAVSHRLAANGRGTRLWLGGSTALAALVLLVLGVQATSGVLGRLPALAELDEALIEGLDWTDLAAEATARGWTARPGLVLAGPQWHQAGKVDVILGDRFPVLCVCRDPRNLLYARDAGALAGRTVVLIGQAEFLDWDWARAFARVTPHPDLVIHRGGRPALTLRVFEGQGFDPAALGLVPD